MHDARTRRLRWRWQKSAGLALVTSRNIVVYNALPAVLLHVAPAGSVGDSLVLSATASSGFGIVSVQFFANDNPLHVVREPDRRNRWVHTVDTRNLPRGLNRFRAVATDANGATVSMDAEYTLDTLPSLSVEGPFEGMIATGGRLNVSGTFGDNVDGAVLSVTLHDAASAMDSTVRIYNLDTGDLTNVTLPGASFVRTLYDLDTTPGSERVLIAATIYGTPGIYSYPLATSTIELLLPGSYRELRTDGTRLAWHDDSDILTGAVLSTALLTDLTAATVLASDYRGSLFVEDGLVGWGGAHPTGLAVYDGSSSTTLSEIGGGFERDAYADGHLIFVDPNELRGWNPTTGEYLLLDAMKPALHTQGVAYLLTGDTGTMYRTTLP